MKNILIKYFLLTYDFGKLAGWILSIEILREANNAAGTDDNILGSLVCDNKFSITVAFLEATIFLIKIWFKK